MPTNEKEQSLFPANDRYLGVLTDSEIEQEVGSGRLISKTTYLQSSVEASSYDISVGSWGVVGGDGREIDLTKEPMELGPGGYGGVISYEKLVLPNQIHARIGSKRALSYDGVILLTGSIVDPGYDGHLLFGLYNASQRKAVIRFKRKICNIVFERLEHKPEKATISEPNLQAGKFPDTFLDRMTNMEVLPWMQISERVKQIEAIAKDILDLKARYEDVLQPIRDLTTSVKSLTDDVFSLTSQTRSIASDVDRINQTADLNSRQIGELTTNVATLVGHIQAVQERTKGLEEMDKTHMTNISGLQTSLGQYKILWYIFWAIAILTAGAFMGPLIQKFLTTPPPP